MTALEQEFFTKLTGYKCKRNALPFNQALCIAAQRVVMELNELNCEPEPTAQEIISFAEVGKNRIIEYKDAITMWYKHGAQDGIIQDKQKQRDVDYMNACIADVDELIRSRRG